MKSPQEQAIEVGKQMIEIETSNGSIAKHRILSKRFERLLKSLSLEELLEVGSILSAESKVEAHSG